MSASREPVRFSVIDLNHDHIYARQIRAAAEQVSFFAEETELAAHGARYPRAKPAHRNRHSSSRGKP